MWPFKKKEKVFTEDFSLDFMHKIYYDDDSFNIKEIFNDKFDVSKLPYVDVADLKSIFVELFSLVYYFDQNEKTNKWLENSFRLEDSINSYILNVKHDDYLYQYTFNDYNKALSDGISVMYKKEDVYNIFQKRLELFKKYQGTKGLSPSPYKDVVISRSLNRIGAQKKQIDKIFYSMSLCFLQNYLPEHDKDDVLKMMVVLQEYYSIINQKLSKVNLY